MTEKKQRSTLAYVLSFAFQFGAVVVISLVVPLLLGVWIDKKMETSPLFLFIGLLVGTVVVIYGVYRLLLPIIRSDEDRK
ncbi:MAG: AtpZ/AtpI family protein [Candidatus Wildermuthbacteria bacterium]|nr:AtpZ/AtpI family protein [Candidatus Wildermuthbacteria bacterium]